MTLLIRAARRCAWLMVPFSLAAAALGQTFIGGWEVIDYGPDQIALWLLARQHVVNPHPTNAYDGRSLPLLNVQCLDGKPDMFINIQFDRPADRVPVRYRVDQEPPVDAVWDVRLPGHLAIAPADRRDFVRSLIGKLPLEFTLDFPAAPTTTRFEIAGLDRGMEKLAARCAW